jgi:hypothetical protein
MMPKYIVSWNAGYGDSYEEVDAADEDEAVEQAYELWKEEAESNADYSVIGEATDELREEYL